MRNLHFNLRNATTQVVRPADNSRATSVADIISVPSPRNPQPQPGAMYHRERGSLLADPYAPAWTHIAPCWGWDLLEIRNDPARQCRFGVSNTAGDIRDASGVAHTILGQSPRFALNSNDATAPVGERLGR